MASHAPDTLLKTRLDAVYPLVAPMSVMDLLGCTLIAWLYWTPASAAALGVWLCGCAAIVAARAGVAVAYRSDRFPDVRARTWGRLIALFAGLSGAMWCRSCCGRRSAWNRQYETRQNICKRSCPEDRIRWAPPGMAPG